MRRRAAGGIASRHLLGWGFLLAGIAMMFGMPSATFATVDNTVDLTPYYDWGAISSFGGTVNGPMGIFTPANIYNFYFPSDSLCPFPWYPKAWLTPGVHTLTRYGPANVRIYQCHVPDAVITVPDADSNPCNVDVLIPPQSYIDQGSDLNVIQISPGETKTVAINDWVNTIVFLACCDGYVTSPEDPSPSQPLLVRLNYSGVPPEDVYVDGIHPAGRLDIIDPSYPPSWIFIYWNEVFVCNPAYLPDDEETHDAYHSEAWHWYTLYPNECELLNSITFEGIQTESDIYILAVSYKSGEPTSSEGTTWGKIKELYR
jgi:hypothetical protein